MHNLNIIVSQNSGLEFSSRLRNLISHYIIWLLLECHVVPFLRETFIRLPPVLTCSACGHREKKEGNVFLYQIQCSVIGEATYCWLYITMNTCTETEQMPTASLSQQSLSAGAQVDIRCETEVRFPFTETIEVVVFRQARPNGEVTITELY